MSTAIADLGRIEIERSLGSRFGGMPTAARISATAQDAGGRPVRITRRGRLAITIAVMLGLLLAALSLLQTITPAGATSSVVVQEGMTLTQIAQEHLPTVPVGQAIIDIQRANNLSTTSIAVGQELRIP